jgi:trk system potassium uptake protein TrkH
MLTGVLKSVLYRPQAILAGTFAGLIVAGTLLLRVPASHNTQTVGLVDALFTATSAVCVTGLITVDTPTAYSRFGQGVILALIQLGGLGIMTFAALAAHVFRLRLSFSSHAAWQSALFEDETRVDLRRALRGIFLMSAAFEGLGAILLYLGLQRTAVSGGWFEAAFHAISAFCNAGFSLYTDNVAELRDSALVLWTLMGLIVAGGLGYTVLFEIRQRAVRRLRRRYDGPVVVSLHTRVVLKVTAGLVLGGALLLLLTGLTPAENTLGSRITHALFQSVTARTAGFNSLNVGLLPLPSLLILIGLMYVGGSPGSCAGGIKTTTAAVWVARVRAQLAGRQDVTLGGRRLPLDVVRRAALVIAVAALWNLVGIFVLSACEAPHSGARLEQLIFEQISAFGTVGLSANAASPVSLSGLFSPFGKLWIAATMFVGRIGPLTLAMAVMPAPRALYEYPTERVMVG